MPKYACEAGRTITRDGVPLFHLARVTDGLHPSDLDDLARTLAGVCGQSVKLRMVLDYARTAGEERDIRDLRRDGVTDCECDNTHQSNNTVCRWCWAHGRRKWTDKLALPS